MDEIKFQLKLDSTDLYQYVVSYTKESIICDGTTSLSVEFAPNLPVTLNPGSELILYELNYDAQTFYKDKEYFVSEVKRSDTNGVYTVQCQDGSKYLQDYFIDDPMETDRGHSTKYWVGKILDRVGIDLVWSASSNGVDMDAVITLGMQSAYDALITLCQQNGWYFYIDSDNRCVVGSVDFSPSNYSFTLTASNILDIKLLKDDEMLRNRAVVWGGTDFNTRNSIFTDRTRHTPWDRDNDDKRAVVITNGAIGSQRVANAMAKQILDEFAKITVTKRIEVDGASLVQPLAGQGVRVKHDLWTGVGMITSLEIKMSNNGYVTTIFLDERCPRLFAYFKTWDFPPFPIPYYPTEPVYVGTDGSGIYTKSFDGATWTTFNDGLTDLYITDLYISDGVFVCTTAGGLAFTRLVGDTVWKPFQPTGIIDSSSENVYDYTEVKAVACCINQTTAEIYVAYNNIDEDRSWVLVIAPDSGNYITKQIHVDMVYDYRTTDMDTNQAAIFVAAEKPGSSNTGLLVGRMTSFSEPSNYFILNVSGTNYTVTPPVGFDFSILDDNQTTAITYDTTVGILPGNLVTATDVSIGSIKFREVEPYLFNLNDDTHQSVYISLTHPEDYGRVIGTAFYIQDAFRAAPNDYVTGTIEITAFVELQRKYGVLDFENNTVSKFRSYTAWPQDLKDEFPYETNTHLRQEFLNNYPQFDIAGSADLGTGDETPQLDYASGLRLTWYRLVSEPPDQTGSVSFLGYLYLPNISDPNIDDFFPGLVDKVILRTNPSTDFEIVFNVGTNQELKIESSQGYPVTLFGRTTTNDSGLLYSSELGEPGSFAYNFDTFGAIPDLRVFDVYGDITTPSGLSFDPSTGESNRYIAYTQNDGTVRYRSIDNLLEDSQILAQFSGSPTTHLDITNYAFSQHFFVSVSGVPARMFQRLNTDTVFYEVSAGLPNSEITIVRLDDYL